jgi:hypothetical protein
MCLPAPVTRLRQFVLAARELHPTVRALQDLLGAADPYADPEVGAFGLANGVLTAGTDFVEVVSPKEPGTSAGRWLDRHGGDGGYMLMVDVAPPLLDRERLQALDVRVVHDDVRPDVTDLHLHPKDVGGVLLALDAVDPPGSWRWGGPAWTGQVPPAARGGLRSVTIAVDDPAAVCRRWAKVLDLPEPDGTQLRLDDGRQRLVFEPGTGEGVSAGVAVTLALPVTRAQSRTIAGVAIDVVPLEEET